MAASRFVTIPRPARPVLVDDPVALTGGAFAGDGL
jgi:hypothetical protein